MAALFSHTFVSARVTEPDLASLRNTLVGLDATAACSHYLDTNVYVVSKATDWTVGQIAAAQNAIDTAPTTTPQLSAQAIIDAWPIELRALALALIDQLNVIRAALPVPLAAITPAQALAAVRAKAGSL